MSVSKKFQKLLDPGRIGRITTKNRIIKTTSSMGYQYDEKDGHMTERQLYFSEAIARGGVGLMISEGGIFYWPIGAHDVFHYRIDDDEYIPGWTKPAEVVHKHGCPLFAQMVHAGPWMSGLIVRGLSSTSSGPENQSRMHLPRASSGGCATST
jgi:2,4-dienoyl-CoA reductase (NADPH2)